MFHGSRLCKLSFGLISKSIFFFLQCMFQGYWNSVSLGCGLPHKTVAEPVTMAQERKNRSSPSHRHMTEQMKVGVPRKTRCPEDGAGWGVSGDLWTGFFSRVPANIPMILCEHGPSALSAAWRCFSCLIQQQLVCSVVHGGHTELSAFRVLSSHKGAKI